jgi:hypothetical protein
MALCNIFKMGIFQYTNQTHSRLQSLAPGHLRRDVHPRHILDELDHRLHYLEHLASEFGGADLPGAVGHHRDLLGLRERGGNLGSDLKEKRKSIEETDGFVFEAFEGAISDFVFPPLFERRLRPSTTISGERQFCFISPSPFSSPSILEHDIRIAKRNSQVGPIISLVFFVFVL